MQLLLGDSLEVLKGLEADSVDSIVTDPPYGLSFMGKKWDYQVPSVELWREVLRVLKPGGHVLSFGGTRTYHRMVVNIEDAGFEIRDQVQWLYGSGFPKSHNMPGGLGTALKPANEPICLARKPISEKTVAANVVLHGTGGLNIDASRVGTEQMGGRLIKQSYGAEDSHFGGGEKRNKEVRANEATGRWPANLILDEEAAAVLDTQQAEVSRFFYVAKASKKERNAGLEGMPLRKRSDANKMMGDAGPMKTGSGNDRTTEFLNHHPTVKPVKLMEYLVRMVTPAGGIVLDPFMGSGTTGVACKNLGFQFIGIELEEAYLQIAKGRIA